MLLFFLEEAVGKKPLPQPYSLDKAMHVIQAGATEVRLDLEANMDAKLAFLIMDGVTPRRRPRVTVLSYRQYFRFM